MFEAIHYQAKIMHGEVKVIFWFLLPLLLAVLITVEILKNDEQGPNVKDILKRTVLAIILLVFFDFTINTIAFVSDGISDQISGNNDLLMAVKSLGPRDEEKGGFFDFRRHIVFFFAVVSYLLAYIGYFTAVGAVNIVWAILYVVSPLMILCHIPKATASICTNLYTGLVKVSVWKVLWSILGAFLLKLSVNPKMVGVEDYILTIVMNILIGVSMLLIPLFTNSLISNGLQNMASKLALVPAQAAGKMAFLMSKKTALKGLGVAGTGLKFAGRPIISPVTNKAKILADKMNLKKRFGIGEKTGKRSKHHQKQRRRSYARRNDRTRRK